MIHWDTQLIANRHLIITAWQLTVVTTINKDDDLWLTATHFRRPFVQPLLIVMHGSLEHDLAKHTTAPIIHAVNRIIWCHQSRSHFNGFQTVMCYCYPIMLLVMRYSTFVDDRIIIWSGDRLCGPADADHLHDDNDAALSQQCVQMLRQIFGLCTQLVADWQIDFVALCLRIMSVKRSVEVWDALSMVSV